MIVPNWLEIAQNELGVMEIPGAEHNARILEYHAATSLKATADEVPWCAAFVSWVLEQAGLRSTRSARARDYLSWGSSINPPPTGAITIIRRGSGRGAAGPEVLSAPGHVGFLLECSRKRITLLGGNQHDSVSMEIYGRDRVLGFRWPYNVPMEGRAA